MTHHQDFLRELDAYAKKEGVDASTVCRKATGNPRLRERLAKRIERTAGDIERLRAFMAANPPVEDAEGCLACRNEVGAASGDCKGDAA